MRFSTFQPLFFLFFFFSFFLFDYIVPRHPFPSPLSLYRFGFFFKIFFVIFVILVFVIRFSPHIPFSLWQLSARKKKKCFSQGAHCVCVCFYISAYVRCTVRHLALSKSTRGFSLQLFRFFFFFLYSSFSSTLLRVFFFFFCTVRPCTSLLR